MNPKTRCSHKKLGCWIPNLRAGALALLCLTLNWSAAAMSLVEKTFADPKVVQLAYRVMDGDLEGMRKLINQGANVKAVGEFGMTLTHYALRARRDAPQVMDMLLKAGADVESPLLRGETVPGYAVARDRADPEVVKVLLAHGVTPNWTPRGADPEDKVSLLMRAIRGHNMPVIQLLVERGADLNFVNPFNGSALHYALVTPQFDVAAYLVDKGIDLSLKSHTSPSIKKPKPITAIDFFCLMDAGKRGANASAEMRAQWDQFVAALARRGVKMPCGL